MCICPNFIWVERGAGYEKMPVPCRECWQCRSNKINDYAGRSLCEASVSDWTVSLTLTYRDCPERDADKAHEIIYKKHAQLFFKQMRNTGHKIRYIACGEKGKLKGRAHFHVLLFGMGKRPDIPNKKNTHIHEWPHGFVFADWEGGERPIRYVVKYLQKYEDTETWFSCSKKPTLGAEWFLTKAKTEAALGILPSSFRYVPPNAETDRVYQMSGATRREYLQMAVTEFIRHFTIRDGRLNSYVKDSLESEARRTARQRWSELPEWQRWETMRDGIDLKRLKPHVIASQLLDTCPSILSSLDNVRDENPFRSGTHGAAYFEESQKLKARIAQNQRARAEYKRRQDWRDFE